MENKKSEAKVFIPPSFFFRTYRRARLPPFPQDDAVVDDAINREICVFARHHRFDDRATYKEAWASWTVHNQELIERETRRLVDLGYSGDVLEKLYKSGRYYYRTRPAVKEPAARRRHYTRLSKAFTSVVDQHVLHACRETDMKPSVGFDDFCAQNTEAVEAEIALVINAGVRDAVEIESKLKKCYKNRYFMSRRAVELPKDSQ